MMLRFTLPFVGSLEGEGVHVVLYIKPLAPQLNDKWPTSKCTRGLCLTLQLLWQAHFKIMINLLPILTVMTECVIEAMLAAF